MTGSEFSIIDFFNGLDYFTVIEMVLAVIPAIICVTIHEYAHGKVALRLGDDTAKNAGRLTLNPFKHIDIVGLIMMIAFRFGWAKPVPVNMYNFKEPKRGMAITALAGPLSNLAVCIAFLFLYGIAEFWSGPLSVGMSEGGALVLQGAVRMLYITAYLSLAFAIFNIIPIPPLDGSKVFLSLFGDEFYEKLMRYEKYGMILLLLLVIFGILGNPLRAVTDYLLVSLSFFEGLGFDLMLALFA